MATRWFRRDEALGQKASGPYATDVLSLEPRVRYTRGNGSPSTVSKQPEIKDNWTTHSQMRKTLRASSLFSCLQHPAMTEILTVAELAAMLKMSKAQVYEMTRERTRNGSMRDNPVPVLRINGNLRFRKADIEAWLEKLVAQQIND